MIRCVSSLRLSLQYGFQLVSSFQVDLQKRQSAYSANITKSCLVKLEEFIRKLMCRIVQVCINSSTSPYNKLYKRV